MKRLAAIALLLSLTAGCSWIQGDSSSGALANQDPRAVAFVETIHKTIFLGLQWQRPIEDYLLNEAVDWRADYCGLGEDENGPFCQRLCRQERIGVQTVETCFLFLGADARDGFGGGPYSLYAASVTPIPFIGPSQQETLIGASIAWHNLHFGRGTYMLGRGPQTWRWFADSTWSMAWDRNAGRVSIEAFDPTRDTMIYHLLYRLPR